MKRVFRAVGGFFKRGSYIAGAAAMAILLGTFETLGIGLAALYMRAAPAKAL